MGYLSQLIKTTSPELSSSMCQLADSPPPNVDLSDRMNWQVTSTALILLTFMLTNISRFVSKRISCAVPIYFSENHEQYANLMCYISEHNYAAANESNTILIAPNQTLVYGYSSTNANTSSQAPKLIGSYHVWLPYLLVLVVLLVLLIELLWMFLLRYFFRLVDLDELLRAARRSKEVPIEKFFFIDFDNHLEINRLLFRNHNISYLFSSLSRIINANASNMKDCTKACQSYMLIKLLNMCLALVNILVIRQFLGIDVFSLAFSQWRSDEASSNDLTRTESAYFPLKSVCVFRIRDLASTNSYAVVCSLPINLFIQFSLCVLSLWYAILLAFNIVYLLSWSIRFERVKQMEYVRDKLANRLRLLIANRNTSKSSCLYLCHLDNRRSKCVKCELFFNHFCSLFLSSDFIFLLQIISVNSNSSIVVENILAYFWKMFIDLIKIRKLIR